MTCLQVSSVGKSFGGHRLFASLDWVISPHARIGLVGANGTGKSTLLRIIEGSEPCDSGEVSRRRGLVVARLPQQVPPDPRTASEIILSSRPEVTALEIELEEIERRLGSEDVTRDLPAMDRLLAQQAQLLDRLRSAGATGAKGEAAALLVRLGLPSNAMEVPLSQLSGGQRKIVHLVACLLRRPGLLLLDEPETNLDLDARAVLEATISEFSGAVVVVSHDRFLLDETVSEIAELDAGTVRIWPGNYSAYVTQREIALRRQQELYVSQQREMARLEEAVRRFQLWARIVVDERHIKQARNKQRQIDQMEKVERPVLERRKVALKIRENSRSGQKVFELAECRIDINGRTILSGVDLTVMRGDRVGVVGSNGTGKTVLLRALRGDVRLAAGLRWVGPSVSTGYFDQHQEALSADTTPLSLVRAARPMRGDQAVSHLTKFLFSYDQVRRSVANLSGGERSRLALLLLMLSEANCLLLDEPTNHLDVDSLEVLERALEDYTGTVVVVSHDRYFLDRIADRIVEIGQGRAVCHSGGYSSLLERKRAPVG